MKHIIPIYEYVKNENDFKWALKYFVGDLQKMSTEPIVSNNLKKDLDSVRYKLGLHNISIPFEKAYIVEKKLLKIQKELLKINYILSYHLSKKYGTDIGDDLSLTPNKKEYLDIIIYIKSIFVMRTSVPDILYHYTNKENIEHIRKFGLIPSEPINYKDAYLHYPPMVFAAKNKEVWKGKKDTLVMFKKGNRKYWGDLNFVMQNIDGASTLVMTDEIVPPSDIVYIKTLNIPKQLDSFVESEVVSNKIIDKKNDADNMCLVIFDNTLTLFNKATKKIYGFISIKKHKNFYSVTSVAAERGFGMKMYFYAMQYVYPHQIAPSRSGDIREKAFKIYENMYDNPLIKKTPFKIEDAFYNFAVLYGEDDMMTKSEKQDAFSDITDEEDLRILNVYNTKYSLEKGAEFSKLVENAKGIDLEKVSYLGAMFFSNMYED